MGKEGVESGEKEPLHSEGSPLWTEIRSIARWTNFEKSWKESIKIWEKGIEEEN
jgi:hypothetical protein